MDIEMEEDDIHSEMSKLGIKKLSLSVHSKMLTLCSKFGMDGESLADCWVAFVSSRFLEQNEPTVELLNQFEREVLMRKINKAVRKKNTQNTPKMKPRLQQIPVTPDSPLYLAENLQSPDIAPLGINKLSVGYSKRTKKGETVTQFGPSVTSWINKHDNLKQCDLKYHISCALNKNYTHMSSKLRERCIAMSDIVDDLANQIGEAENLEWDAFNLPNTDLINVAGRICCDGEGKLNSTSVLIEGSHAISNGFSVPVDVSSIERYSLFPGQVIAGQGLNPSGKNVILKKLLPPSNLPFSESEIDFGNRPVDALIAAGPFTPSDSLAFEPLNDLLEYVKKFQPDYCVLIGPFLELKSKCVQEFDGSVTFRQVFEQRLESINESAKGLKTKFVLVSNAKDLNCEYVYPTPPYCFDKKSLEKSFLCCPDPCLLDLDGFVIGITSTDILFHLAKEEISYPPGQEDRLGRLTSHLLSQRSFYPLSPPSEELCLDYEKFELYARLQITPHLLILPSDLKHFVKNINGCVAVNPERLTKGNGGGTFARIRLTPPVQNNNSQQDVWKGISAEIVRI